MDSHFWTGLIDLTFSIQIWKKKKKTFYPIDYQERWCLMFWYAKDTDYGIHVARILSSIIY